MVDLLGQLETSYRTKKGYWKGGTVGVFGYGGGVIPRFTELKDDKGAPVFPDAAEFHTLRVQPPPGMHYDTAVLRKMCDIWERARLGPDRLPRPERRHHVPGRQDRQGAGRL
jgi:sulfite reductase alpha subunit